MPAASSNTITVEISSIKTLIYYADIFRLQIEDLKDICKTKQTKHQLIYSKQTPQHKSSNKLLIHLWTASKKMAKKRKHEDNFKLHRKENYIHIFHGETENGGREEGRWRKIWPIAFVHLANFLDSLQKTR